MQTVTFTIETDSESQIEAIKDFLCSLKIKSRIIRTSDNHKKRKADRIDQSNAFEVPAEHQELVLQRIDKLKSDSSTMMGWADVSKLINE